MDKSQEPITFLYAEGNALGPGNYGVVRLSLPAHVEGLDKATPNSTNVTIEVPLVTPIDRFGDVFNISRTMTYDEINSGRLKIRKIGGRSIVTGVDLIDYLLRLPFYQPRKKEGEE